jgi:hypothetical protein
MPWYFGFILGIMVAVIAKLSRGNVPASRRRKIQRPWWYTQENWDRRRGYTEKEYAEWRKEMRRKENEKERERANKEE